MNTHLIGLHRLEPLTPDFLMCIIIPIWNIGCKLIENSILKFLIYHIRQNNAPTNTGANGNLSGHVDIGQ